MQGETKRMQYTWEYGFTIEVQGTEREVVIKANAEGLISLSNLLLTLAQKTEPFGAHIHLDEFNALEKGSTELILEKKEFMDDIGSNISIVNAT